MIIDQLENINNYKKLIPNLDIGLNAIQNIENKPVERYEFDGGYFMIQEGITKPMEEGLFESHKKYIDIQIVVKGKEEIAWMPLSELTAVQSYDEKLDKQKFTGLHVHHMTITEGMFWIAFPWDGHQAISNLNEENDYRKIVLKLPIMEEQ